MFSSRPRAGDRIRIFALPYAGGTASAYRAWLQMPGVQTSCVEYPGHGIRMAEPVTDDMGTLVTGLADRMVDEIEGDYALFGHSMGAIVAFELAHALQSRGVRSPLALFVSGSQPPRNNGGDGGFQLTDRGILERLARLGATPLELLSNPEMREHIITTMRADGRALENYAPTDESPLDLPLVAFGGDADPLVPVETLQGWARFTTRPLRTDVRAGDHFYLSQHMSEIFTVMVRTAAIELGQRRRIVETRN